jgi:hypothetical protein
MRLAFFEPSTSCYIVPPLLPPSDSPFIRLLDIFIQLKQLQRYHKLFPKVIFPTVKSPYRISVLHQATSTSKISIRQPKA